MDGGRHRDPCRAISRETIDAGGNGGKSHRCKAVRLAEFDRAGVARCQRLIFALASAVPHRANSMNDMPRRQTITSGDFGVAGLAATERAAFGYQFGAGRAMDSTIDAGTAE